MLIINSSKLFYEGTEEGHVAVVVAEAAALAGVRGAVVAAVGAAEGVDEDGGALAGEPVVVAVGGIVAPRYLGRQALHVVDALQQLHIRRRLAAVGVDDHEALVAAAEQVYVHQQLHLAQLYQRMFDEPARPHEAALLAAEEEEDIGVVATLPVGHAREVHHRCRAAGVVVGAVEDSVAAHAQMLVVGGEDDHGVRLAGDVAANVLGAVAGGNYRRPRARLWEAEVLVVVVAERLHAVGHQLAAQVVGGDGVAAVLHAAPEHLLRRQVADDAARVAAVLRGGHGRHQQHRR